MAIPYVVRKKVDATSGKRKELWYAVAKKVQNKGGMRSKGLAAMMEKTAGFHRGVIEGVLAELVDNIFMALAKGETVTIDGLGSFQVSLTSPGCEHPEEVTPGKVSVSRVYFVAHPELSRKVKEIKCMRIPFCHYVSAKELTKNMEKADLEQEKKKKKKYYMTE